LVTENSNINSRTFEVFIIHVSHLIKLKSFYKIIELTDESRLINLDLEKANQKNATLQLESANKVNFFHKILLLF